MTPVKRHDGGLFRVCLPHQPHRNTRCALHTLRALCAVRRSPEQLSGYEVICIGTSRDGRDRRMAIARSQAGQAGQAGRVTTSR